MDAPCRAVDRGLSGDRVCVNKSETDGVLALYLEPTPYILGLVERLQGGWPGPVDVCFVARDLSQAWGLSSAGPDAATLPQGHFAASRILWKGLRSGRYRLLHLAGWGHPLLLTAILMSRLLEIPVVVESDTPLAQGPMSWRKRFKRVLHPLLFRLPSMFLPGGQRQAEYLRHYGVGPERIHVAQMTVDVTAIMRHIDAVGPGARPCLRDRVGLSAASVVFLYVGRLEAHKGVDDLLEAFRRLRAERTDVELLVVGDGSLRERLQADAMSVAGVRIAGRLQDGALLDAYALADVFVLPSRFEPWGLVVNESMAAGLPVIVSDQVGCIDDLVVADSTGLVVPARDPTALYSAMHRLAVDAATRHRMAESARERIAGWTLENEAVNVIHAWREVIGS